MRIIILLSIIMLGGLSQNGHAQDRVDDTPYDYYVRLTSNEYRPTQETGTKGTVSFSFPKHPELTTLFAQYGVSAFDFTFKHAVVEGLKRTYLMNVPVKEAEFQRLLESRYDHIFEFVTPMADYESFYEPDDYDIQSLDATWHLDLIGAKDAWDITTGDPNVFLGICELKGSGIDLQHPEVKDKIVRHLDYWPNNLSNVHGTAVAALAAGDTDNGEGTAAIGFNTRMVTLLGFNPILQLDSMIEMGVRVFNFSFGSYTGRQVDQEAMTDAYLRGAILIAGAGNDYPAPRAYPAAYDHVISVTSVGPQMNHEKTVGDPTSTHWHGPSIDLVAPGYDLVIPKGGYYGRGNGSSFAAPVVAGLVGLMLSVNPCLSAADVELILKTTALPVDNLPINAAYVGELGAGLIQAEAAVQMAASYVSAFPYQQRLNPSFNHYVACDENMDLRLHVSGFKNSLSTQHQWNLYEQSNTQSALETLSWWQISPNGYNRDTSVFQTALQPHTNYMVKRGVWDGCNPWTERRVYSINAPSCFEQYGYELVALPEANGCMGAYEVRGDSMHLIDRVNFTLQGATTRNYTDNAFPFYQPIDVYGDTQITAVIHFTNGKVYTLAKTIPACDSNLPWRAATEEVTEIATELTIYPNPATGETVQLRHASTATRAIVYSLSGQRLVEQALNSSGTSALPIGSLETGMYVIQVMDEASGSQTLKFQVE